MNEELKFLRKFKKYSGGGGGRGSGVGGSGWFRAQGGCDRNVGGRG